MDILELEVCVGKRVTVKSRKEAVKTVLLGAHQAEPGFIKGILQNKLVRMTNPINYIKHTIELQHFMSFLVLPCEWSQEGET